jgi:hypothetical protein
LRPYELGIVASSYMLTGRFNPELEVTRRPTEEASDLEAELREARAAGDRDKEQEYKQQLRSARASALGTKEEWSGYDTTVRQYEAEAVGHGYASDLESLRKLPRRTVATSWIKMDERGGLWLSPRDGRSGAKVGLSANTLTGSSSDAKLGYLLALSRVDAELRKTPKNRETLEFFRKDWQLMEQLRGRVVPVVAGTRQSEDGGAAQ